MTTAAADTAATVETPQPTEANAPKLYTLQHPIERGEGEQPITGILLRRARAKDIIAMQRALKDAGMDEMRITYDEKGTPTVVATAEQEMTSALAFLASLAGVTFDVISEIDMVDLTILTVEMERFFPKRRQVTPAQ